MRLAVALLLAGALRCQAQSIPAASPSAPADATIVPIAPGKALALGSSPYVYLDSIGDIEASDLILKGGRVDVRSVLFATGCANGADQTGKLDSLCAINNGLAWIVAHPIAGAGYSRLYFPHGRYMIGSLPGVVPYTSLLHITAAIGLVGDGPVISIIDNRSANATTLLYDGAGNCNGAAGAECPILVDNLTFHQAGHLGLGDGIEGINTSFVMLSNVQIENSGGAALSLGGSSERWLVEKTTIGNSQASVREVGDTNENTFTRVNVIAPGVDETGYCYSSVTCINHLLPAVGQTWYPDPRPAVYLDGVKSRWIDSSFKSLQYMSGIRAPRELGLIENNYFEGNAYAGQPRFNFAVEAGGKMELSHTLSAMTTASTTVTVDDALFEPMYVDNPADVEKEGAHAGADAFCFYPADYLASSTAMSTAVPAIARGTSECVQVWGFGGDGRAYLRQRGASPVAWPVGSILEQVPRSAYGPARLVANHFNSNDSIAVYGASTFLDGCDDAAPRAGWVGNPSRVCAAILDGYVPDGYAVPFPTATVGSNLTVALSLQDNTNYTGGPEVDGIGYIKVMLDGYVTIYGDTPLGQVPNLDQVRSTYASGGYLIYYANYAGVWAQGSISDPGAQVFSEPSWNYFDAVIPQYNQGSVHVRTQAPCDANLVNGSVAVTEEHCYGSDGSVTTNDLIAGQWVRRPGTARVYSAPLTMTALSFAAAPAGGHVESGLSGWCPVGQGAWTTSVPGFQPNAQGMTVTFAPALPDGFTWMLSYNGFGAAAGNQPSANIHLEVCNTVASAQTLPAGEQAFVQQVQN